MKTKMKIKKGDTVMVVSGKDKGKTGVILEVIPSTGKIVVEDVALAKRHLKGTRGGQSAGIVERPRAIDASNVMLVDPKGKKPTRVGRSVVDGKIVRIAKKSGTTLA
jgi:large subunit ribosomal protein L24